MERSVQFCAHPTIYSEAFVQLLQYFLGQTALHFTFLTPVGGTVVHQKRLSQNSKSTLGVCVPFSVPKTEDGLEAKDAFASKLLPDTSNRWWSQPLTPGHRYVLPYF